ncbi:hypothetical protein [Circo-like virus-Brazil hs1]|uniref:hypothetical protein n=1 Tax=Circo-like virus-Brazil hs1 TaxID=1346815 RepID=UPI0003B064AE|nr:hypothetical protein [Circo-like virus-Brazil hs1]AGO61976.1 hypothetical protein [Circo-like virus-Brazil hs1]AGO61980.1 hypothetical protein [Circo-like virus-Brazil hs2]
MVMRLCGWVILDQPPKRTPDLEIKTNLESFLIMSWWDDIPDESFYYIDTPVFKSAYETLSDREAIKISNLVELRKKELKKLNKYIASLYVYKYKLDGRDTIYNVRNKATEVRNTIEKIASNAKVKWSSKGWKGWDIERKAFKKFKKNYPNSETDYTIIVDLMAHYFIKMGENLKDLIDRRLKTTSRKKYRWVATYTPTEKKIFMPY